MIKASTSRRDFIRGGFTIAGASMMGTAITYAADCDTETLSAPGPIPLNNFLISYHEVNKKFGHGLAKSTICDQAGWENRRLSILRRARLMLGEGPLVAGPVDASVLDKTQRDGYLQSRIQFPSGTGDMIKGYLLVPDNASVSAPRPAIIALHSTGPGATQTVGLTPKEGRSYGMELAQRGYVVLAIDTIAAGERIYPGFEEYYTDAFYGEFPRWSAMGKMIHDHQKGVDYLCSLDVVDPQRIGCIGHSLGGYNSFFLHAFDPRIKAAVSSCGLSTMGGTLTPYQFARGDWFVHFNPACRDYIQAGMIPCDLHEFMALCAPRPLFNYSARKDSIYNPATVQNGQGFKAWWQSVDNALSQVSKLYEILGKPDYFVRVEDDGGHDFPAHVREQAYRWLGKWLAHT